MDICAGNQLVKVLFDNLVQNAGHACREQSPGRESFVQHIQYRCGITQHPVFRRLKHGYLMSTLACFNHCRIRVVLALHLKIKATKNARGFEFSHEVT